MPTDTDQMPQLVPVQPVVQQVIQPTQRFVWFDETDVDDEQSVDFIKRCVGSDRIFVPQPSSNRFRVFNFRPYF